MLRFSAKVLDDKLRQHGALGGIAWRELPWVLNLNGLPLHAAVLSQGGNHRCQRLLRSFFLSAYSLRQRPASRTISTNRSLRCQSATRSRRSECRRRLKLVCVNCQHAMLQSQRATITPVISVAWKNSNKPAHPAPTPYVRACVCLSFWHHLNGAAPAPLQPQASADVILTAAARLKQAAKRCCSVVPRKTVAWAKL